MAQRLPPYSATGSRGEPLGSAEVLAMAPVLLVLLRGVY